MDLVQPAPPGLETEAPLVLIHDGGGTVVSYFHLGSLDRTVYAIQNPRFYSGEPWEDGLPEMAREYTQSIKSEIPSGPILLGGRLDLAIYPCTSRKCPQKLRGRASQSINPISSCALGWSLGGLLSLEIASILGRSSDIQVLGVIMIDSVFPRAVKADGMNVVPSEPIFGISTNAMMRARVSHSMNQALSMAKTWIPPVWKDCSDPEEYRRRVQLEEALAAKSSVSADTTVATTGETATAAGMDSLPPAPQTVLLRCIEYIPVTHSDRPDAIARVDVLRDQEKLGWDDYPYGFISAVLEIPGHHFNIFTEDYVSGSSAALC